MPTRRARSDVNRPSGSSRSLDRQEIPVAGIDAVELLGPQDLVLGKVNLAAAPDRRIDEAVDGLAAGGLVALLRVELEVEAVAVFGERNQAVVRLVGAQDGRDRRAGRRLADSQQLDDRFARAGSRKGELDGIPVRAADEVGRRHGEAGLETEPAGKVRCSRNGPISDTAAGTWRNRGG